jgi:hypothetical protein
MSQYCACDNWVQILRCCRTIAANAKELEKLLETLTPSTNILLLEDAASKLAARGIKVTIQNLVAAGLTASIFQDVAVKKRLLDLKHKYNTLIRPVPLPSAPEPPPPPGLEPALRTDDSGYLLSGLDFNSPEPN